MKHEYSRLIKSVSSSSSSEDGDNDLEIQPYRVSNHKHRVSNIKVVCLMMGTLFVLIVTFAISLTFGSDPAHKASYVLKIPCGNNSVEAIARGCRFNHANFAWNHPRCHNEALVQDFLDKRDWRWYTDMNGTEEIPFEVVARGNLSHAFVTWEFHLQHCTLMWRLLHQQGLKGLGKPAVDSYIGNMEHTKHCSRLIAKADKSDMQEINTEILQKFPDCGVL